MQDAIYSLATAVNDIDSKIASAVESIAAAVAGLGTKTYLDKKEEKETSSDEETIATDESINQIDVNYEDPEETSADYILPTDELAFEEN